MCGWQVLRRVWSLFRSSPTQVNDNPSFMNQHSSGSGLAGTYVPRPQAYAYLSHAPTICLKETSDHRRKYTCRGTDKGSTLKLVDRATLFRALPKFL